MPLTYKRKPKVLFDQIGDAYPGRDPEITFGLFLYLKETVEFSVDYSG